MADVDADGADTLTRLDRELNAMNVDLHVATLRGPVRDLLTRSGLLNNLVAQNRYHPSIERALSVLDLPLDSPLLAPLPGEIPPDNAM